MYSHIKRWWTVDWGRYGTFKTLSALFLIAFASVGFAQYGCTTLEGCAPSTVTGTITTYAGPSASVNGTPATIQVIDHPQSVASDGSEAFYFTAGNRIYYVAANGSLTVIAGSGTAGFSGDGGAATSAELN